MKQKSTEYWYRAMTARCYWHGGFTVKEISTIMGIPDVGEIISLIFSSELAFAQPLSHREAIDIYKGVQRLFDIENGNI